MRDELAAGRPIRLNLGVGHRPRQSYYGLDWIEMSGVDVVADLNEPLSDLPDNSVEAIYTHHTLEHVVNLLPLLKEIHRVVIPNGRVEIVVPHFSNPYGYSDPRTYVSSAFTPFTTSRMKPTSRAAKCPRSIYPNASPSSRSTSR